MKTVVFGDIHGRDIWKQVIGSELPDKVIFLGDYFTSRENISEEDQVSNLKDILTYRKDNRETVIMLRGNHDTEALGYEWAMCSPTFYRKDLLEPLKETFLEESQWAYEQDGIIFSHAGISETWLKLIGISPESSDIVDQLNSKEPCSVFGFRPGPDNPWDRYGESVFQPCTWIRPRSLMKSMIGKTQVVGHTRSSAIGCEQVNDRDNCIWLCDRLPYSCLVIEDGSIESKTLRENHGNF